MMSAKREVTIGDRIFLFVLGLGMLLAVAAISWPKLLESNPSPWGERGVVWVVLAPAMLVCMAAAAMLEATNRRLAVKIAFTVGVVLFIALLVVASDREYFTGWVNAEVRVDRQQGIVSWPESGKGSLARVSYYQNWDGHGTERIAVADHFPLLIKRVAWNISPDGSVERCTIGWGISCAPATDAPEALLEQGRRIISRRV